MIVDQVPMEELTMIVDKVLEEEPTELTVIVPMEEATELTMIVEPAISLSSLLREPVIPSFSLEDEPRHYVVDIMP